MLLVPVLGSWIIHFVDTTRHQEVVVGRDFRDASIGSAQTCQHMIALLPLLQQPSNRCQPCIPNWQWGSIQLHWCSKPL
ncbi:hypothetical protein V8C34DRAFT_279344 [Trichoderma compactum]